MNKSNKEYVTGRIRSIVRDAIKSLTPESAPTVEDAIMEAISAGTAKLRPVKDVIATASLKALRDGFGSDKLTYSEIFCVPPEHAKALKEHDRLVKANAKAVEKAQSTCESIIDTVWLDGYESGEEAIKDAKNAVSILLASKG